MHRFVRLAAERLLRPVGALLILLALIGPLATAPHAAAQNGGDEPLDLAAMSLTPWDLADAGFDEYGHGFSEMVFLDALVANIAADRGLDEDEVREQLEDAGFLRAYYAYFSSPAENEDVNQMVVS